MQKTGDIIKQAREEKGMVLAELAKLSGATPGFISQWENGHNTPGDRLAQRICKILDINFANIKQLLDIEKYNYKREKLNTTFSNVAESRETYVVHSDLKLPIGSTATICASLIPLNVPVLLVPLLGEVPAGNPVEVPPAMASQAEDWVSVNADVISNIAQVFALRVRGISMVGKNIQEGDIIVVDAEKEVEDGNIAVVMVNGEVTVKSIYKNETGYILQSSNPDIPPLHLTKADGFRVIGRVISVIKNFL